MSANSTNSVIADIKKIAEKCMLINCVIFLHVIFQNAFRDIQKFANGTEI